MTGQLGTFAYTTANAEALAAHDRSMSVRRAMDLILQGRPGFAEYTLGRSVMRQAHLFGAALTGTPEIVPASPKSKGNIKWIHVDRLGRARTRPWETITKENNQ